MEYGTAIQGRIRLKHIIVHEYCSISLFASDNLDTDDFFRVVYAHCTLSRQRKGIEFHFVPSSDGHCTAHSCHQLCNSYCLGDTVHRQECDHLAEPCRIFHLLLAVQFCTDDSAGQDIHYQKKISYTYSPVACLCCNRCHTVHFHKIDIHDGICNSSICIDIGDIRSLPGHQAFADIFKGN